MSELRSAKRSLTLEPSSPETLEGIAAELMNGDDYEGGRVFSARALCIRPDNPMALFQLYLAADAAADEAQRRKLRRQILCVAPADEKSLHCATWSSTLLRNLSLVLQDSRRDEIYVWLMRSCAVLGFKPPYATVLAQYFRDRLSLAFLWRLFDWLGRVSTDVIETAASLGGRHQYVIHGDLLGYFGEIVATCDCLHKMMALGLLPTGNVNFLTDGQRLANRAAVDLWPGTVRLLERRVAARLLGSRFVRLNPLLLPFGKRFYLKPVVFAAVQRLWEKHQRPVMLDGTVRSRLRARFEAFVGRLGWPRADRVVCFHVRESIYDRGSTNFATQRFRNSDPAKFQSALLMLAERGFRIIRIGAAGGYGYESRHGYFDYANCDEKAEDLDVAIMANACFHFGTDSGPASVSYIFDKPACIIDFAQLGAGLTSGSWLFSPRPYWSEPKRRFLTLKEMVRQPFRHLAIQDTLDEHGITLAQGTEDEVCAVIEEFLGRFESRTFFDETTFGTNQREAKRVFRRNKVVMNALPSERFLESHPFLLEG